ncbi:MAG: hypothetical protein AAFN27_01245 [Pseudomonadota bacterium]
MTSPIAAFSQESVMEPHCIGNRVQQNARKNGSCLTFCFHYAKAVMNGRHRSERILDELRAKAANIIQEQTEASIDAIFSGQTYMRKYLHKHGLDFDDITSDENLSEHSIAPHTMALHSFYHMRADEHGDVVRGAHAILHMRYADETVRVFEPNFGVYLIPVNNWRAWTRNQAALYGTTTGHIFLDLHKRT